MRQGHHTRLANSVALPRTRIVFLALVLLGLGGMLWARGVSASIHRAALDPNVTSHMVGATATPSSLILDLPSTPVKVGATRSFTATASLPANPNSLDFRLDWDFGGVFFYDLKTTTQSTLIFPRAHTFVQIGRHPITATLYLNDVYETAPIVGAASTLIVGGGVITPTLAGNTAFVAAPTAINLALPAARPDAYRLVLDFGDHTGFVTSTVTATLMLPAVTTISRHFYRASGSYNVVANLYPADGPVDATTLLATGATTSPINVIVGKLYLPLVTNPAPPPVITITACNDQEPNNIPLEAKSLDPSAGQAALHTTNGVQCNGSLQSDPVGEDDYYAITLQPGQVLDVQLTRIPTGADYDLYLYNAQGATIADRVAKSNQVGTADELIVYQHPLGLTPLTYYLRVYQYQKSATAENTYRITANLK